MNDSSEEQYERSDLGDCIGHFGPLARRRAVPALFQGRPGNYQYIRWVAEPTEWAELMHRPEAEIHLDQGALLIAAEADPHVDVDRELAKLDAMAERVDGADSASICRLLFDTLGIRGDRQTYDDPQNSYLHRVIARRLGIPITLSVLLIEIGRRRGVVLEGVGMPGHFLVRDPSSPNQLIDAFSGGQRLDEAGCAELMRSVNGPGLEFQAAMLRPVGPRAILARMLANLDMMFRRQKNVDGCRWVTRLRTAIPGIPLEERLALVNGLAQLGCYEDAVVLLNDMAADPGTSIEDAEALKGRSRLLLSRFN